MGLVTSGSSLDLDSTLYSMLRLLDSLVTPTVLSECYRNLHLSGLARQAIFVAHYPHSFHPRAPFFSLIYHFRTTSLQTTSLAHVQYLVRVARLLKFSIEHRKVLFNVLAIVCGCKLVFLSLDLFFLLLPGLTVGGPLPVSPSQ
jgi:hypothetical protein